MPKAGSSRHFHPNPTSGYFSLGGPTRFVQEPRCSLVKTTGLLGFGGRSHASATGSDTAAAAGGLIIAPESTTRTRQSGQCRDPNSRVSSLVPRPTRRDKRQSKYSFR